MCDSLTDRVTFLPGAPQNVTIGVNETLQAVASAIPVDVAFVTLQFHTQDHNATLSYNRVSPGSSTRTGPSSKRAFRGPKAAPPQQ